MSIARENEPLDADEIASLMRECMSGGNTTGALQKTRHRFIAMAG